MALNCHILIGCPSSGKSYFASYIIEKDANYQIVSTDKIREKLFGNENIQGDWQLIETEIFRQIDSHIQEGKPIIYDATNAQKLWRISLLEKLSKYHNINWIGWYLTTPLDVCLAWNRKRDRTVPDDVIIKLYQSLKDFPPLQSEGFFAVYRVPFQDGRLKVDIYSGFHPFSPQPA